MNTLRTAVAAFPVAAWEAVVAGSSWEEAVAAFDIQATALPEAVAPDTVAVASVELLAWEEEAPVDIHTKRLDDSVVVAVLLQSSAQEVAYY